MRVGDALDVVLVLLAALYAVRGFRRGLMVGLASLAGFVGGAVAGTRVTGALTGRLPAGPGAALAGLAVVLVAGLVGEEVLVLLAAVLRRHLPLGPLRHLDALGGAALAVVGFLFVAWLLAVAAARSPFPSLVRQVRDSRVLTAVDGVVPANLYTDFAAFLRAASQGTLPLIAGLGAEPIRPVPPAPASAVPRTVLAGDAASIVKIQAVQPQCGRASEGSGFVVAPGEVLTNAHVVAGANRVTVAGDGTGAVLALPATVVLYDPHRDVALLRVPGLRRRPLRFAGRAGPNAAGAVAGYPEDGPFTVVPARVRQLLTVTGPDIYASAMVTREMYALRSVVRPGNSGGPFLAPSGAVDGVVFAASTTDAQTGYALTAAEVLPDVLAGARRDAAVGTGGCD